jgi:hypothetical protein
MKEGSRNEVSLCKVDLEGSFTEEPKDMLNKARKWASASVRAPILGNIEGRFFLGVFLLEEFLRGF